MTIVDERGRLYGRVNLIDAAVAAIVLVLIPFAYGSYLLFRSPPAKVLGINPSRLYQGNDLKVEIQGQDLRPFMRVSFNDVQGRTFLISSPQSAFVDLPALGAGVYDVVLYDYSQEVARLPKALTIMPLAPTPAVEMEVTGAFVGVTPEQLAELKQGLRFPPTGEAQVEVLKVGRPVPGHLTVRAGNTPLTLPLDTSEVPASLRVQCHTTPNPDGSLGCTVSGTQQPSLVAPNSMLILTAPSGWFTYQIANVHLSADPQVAEMRVRFVATSELASQMKPGDSDGGAMASGSLYEAVVTALGPARPITAAEAGSLAPLGGNLRAVDATLRLPVDQVNGVWMYKNQRLKTGAPLTFETLRYVVHGEVIDLKPPASPATTPGK